MYQVILTVLLCWAGCMWAGSLKYGPLIFNREMQAFQFVPLGLLGGILVVGAFRLRSSRFYLLVLVVAVLMKLTTGSDTSRLILRDVVIAHALALAIYLGAALNTYLPRLVFGKFLLWGVLCAGSYALATYMLAQSFGWTEYGTPLLVNTTNGLLTGSGLGLGAELAALIIRRYPQPTGASVLEP